MDDKKLIFKVGQNAEARSFEPGFRGAWFRCKIKNIYKKDRRVRYALEYFDFPDEKVEWTHLYRQTGKGPKGLQLVLRPCFPPVYREGNLPDTSTISEEVVVVNNAWKKGDLVDWWSDDCYWSGFIYEIIGDDKFQINLFPPPQGEGSSYEASCKDLRPSLKWSPEHGWTIPISKDGSSCARLVKPVKQANAVDEKDPNTSSQFQHLDIPEQEAGQTTACTDTQALKLKNLSDNGIGKSDCSNGVSTSLQNDYASGEVARDIGGKNNHSDNLPSKKTRIDGSILLNSMCSDTVEAVEVKDLTDNGIGKSSCSDSISSLHDEDASGGVAGEKNNNCDNVPTKKMRTDGSILLNSMCSDTIEAAIWDLEELVNRVKWYKDILEFGFPLPNSVHTSWKFMEHRASSLPK